MKQYEYMITFAFPGGVGRTAVLFKKEINSMKDVRDIDDYLRSDSSYIPDIPANLKSQLYVQDFKLLGIHDDTKRKLGRRFI